MPALLEKLLKLAAPGPDAASLGVQSVLHKARQADIVRDPFPHIVIPNALDPALYSRLEAEFPSDEAMLQGRPAGNNVKHFYGSCEVLKDERISPLWRNFFQYHTSARFYREMLGLFGADIRTLHPKLEKRMNKKLKDLKVGVRRMDPSAEAIMECQFGINSPVLENPSSVRGPHIDGPDTLYQCMLYFRREDDRADGNLELYRFNEGADLSAATPKAIDPDLVSRAATVPYEKNMLIVFLNSPRSLHGVSPRGVTALTRRYVGILCDLPLKIFPRQLSRALPA